MRGEASPDVTRVRAAEVVASLSLVTDLAMGLPLEHGLHSTLAAMRLGEHLGVDRETANQTYNACLLFYVGCTADAEIVADIFPDDAALLTHFTRLAARGDGGHHAPAGSAPRTQQLNR